MMANFDPWPSVRVHLEWGREGAQLAAGRGDVVVIVDVLSFSTSVAIVVDRGGTALVAARDEVDVMRARAEAGGQPAAEPIAERDANQPERRSLSPASVLTVEPGERLIFTSLNGANCVVAATKAPLVMIASLVNATAVGQALTSALADDETSRATLVPCGERWQSVVPGAAGYRPAIEDWLAAGAVAAVLAGAGYELSSEASLSALAYEGASTNGQVATLVAESVSGRELTAAGFGRDVDVATAVDTVGVVPAWRPDPAGLELREFRAFAIGADR